MSMNSTKPLSREDLKAEIASLSAADLALVREDVQKRVNGSLLTSYSIQQATEETAKLYLEVINEVIAERTA